MWPRIETLGAWFIADFASLKRKKKLKTKNIISKSTNQLVSENESALGDFVWKKWLIFQPLATYSFSEFSFLPKPGSFLVR